jgi:hypothetical protein
MHDFGDTILMGSAGLNQPETMDLREGSDYSFDVHNICGKLFKRLAYAPESLSIPVPG